MNELQQAHQQGKIEAKLEHIGKKVDEINLIVHNRIDGTKESVEALEKDMNQLKGGLKTLWGVIFILVTLCGGLVIKMFWG